MTKNIKLSEITAMVFFLQSNFYFSLVYDIREINVIYVSDDMFLKKKTTNITYNEVRIIKLYGCEDHKSVRV